MVLAKQALDKTVRSIPDEDAVLPQSFLYTLWRSRLLPPKGELRRDRALMELYYDDFSWLFRGAVSAICKQIASTPYELKGDKEHKILVRYFEDLLSHAEFGDFGGGFYGFISRGVLNFLRYDTGWLIEIIGDGPIDKPITGRVKGIAMLDNMRCRLTGIPETPVDYWPLPDPTGKRYGVQRMHRTRVARLVDMPDSLEQWYGLGDCALSRACSLVNQQIVMDQYNIQRLDDLPPAGIMAVSNVKNWDDAMALYEAGRQRDAGSVWANVMYLDNVEPDKPIGLQFEPFASVPEHFDYEKYIDIQVKAVALALNVDPQDIWPLAQNQMGTGTQTKILHTKAAGKMLGTLRTIITRFINFFILPDSLEFQFKFADPEQDRDTAETEKVLTDTALNMKQLFSPEVAAQYLVNTSDRMADVLLDEQGQLRLPSEDPKPPEIPQVITDADVQPQEGTPAPPDDQTTVDSETPLPTQKDVQATRLDFEADVSDAIQAARDSDVNRRRFGVIMRGHIAKYMRKAFEDGLIKGGVPEPPDDEDLKTIAGMVAAQSQFVTGLGDTLFKDGITDAQADMKAAQWWVISVQPAYHAGIASADKNGMYEWVLGVAEHCNTCKKLAGQIHRMKDWIKKGFFPGCNKLDCFPGPCACKFVRREGVRARGRFA